MAQVIDYEYIEEVSTLDALRNLASDTTNWYSQEMPWVNTFLINASNQAYNFPDWWGGGTWIAWWSTDVNWTATDYNTLSWGNGSIYMPDWTTLSVSSGNTWNMSATTYIYYDMDALAVNYTTTASSAVWENKILLCVAAPTSSWKDCAFQAFGTNKQSLLITADNIAANTITANEIYSNTITANEIASGAITTSKIDAWAVTASKIDVSELSAITANLWDVHVGTTSWTWTWIRIYPYSSSAWRIQFYRNWSNAWYISWWTVDWNSAIVISASYFWMTSGTMIAWGKLRIPVWTDLYE